MPTMGDYQPDFFCYVHFSIIISILFSLDIQINILKMSTCLVVLSENYKKDFDWFGAQVVEARHGGDGETCTLTSGRWDTEGQNKTVGTPITPQLCGLFCVLGSMFHSFNIYLLRVSHVPGKVPVYDREKIRWGLFSSGILYLEPKTVNNRLNLYYILW